MPRCFTDLDSIADRCTCAPTHPQHYDDIVRSIAGIADEAGTAFFSSDIVLSDGSHLHPAAASSPQGFAEQQREAFTVWRGVDSQAVCSDGKERHHGCATAAAAAALSRAWTVRETDALERRRHSARPNCGACSFSHASADAPPAASDLSLDPSAACDGSSYQSLLRLQTENLIQLAKRLLADITAGPSDDSRAPTGAPLAGRQHVKAQDISSAAVALSVAGSCSDEAILSHPRRPGAERNGGERNGGLSRGSGEAERGHFLECSCEPHLSTSESAGDTK